LDHVFDQFEALDDRIGAFSHDLKEVA
jgi:hypothetical protein